LTSFLAGVVVGAPTPIKGEIKEEGRRRTFWTRNHVSLTVSSQNKKFLSPPVDVGIKFTL
jgi:hypothetical protein